MRYVYRPIFILFMVALLSGCATMSKKECLNANWDAIGYSDGSRGIHYSHLEKRRQSCLEYQVVPDDIAYRHGWDQGIRRYCTSTTGYNLGTAGKAYPNICPSDVAADFRSGWEQGIGNYCTPENGLHRGLAGYHYSGVCPPHLAPAFEDFYRLGSDVRHARSQYEEAEEHFHETEEQLADAKEPHQRRELRHRLDELQRSESTYEARVIALEACMSRDWYDIGRRDADEGSLRRSHDIASLCRQYGIGSDARGYNQGWLEGMRSYCTYENGRYLGQSNRNYSGICAGNAHRRFWQGYEQGHDLYLKEQYDAPPKSPVRKPVERAPEHRGKLPRHEEDDSEKRAPTTRQQPGPDVSIPEKQIKQLEGNGDLTPAPDSDQDSGHTDDRHGERDKAHD